MSGPIIVPPRPVFSASTILGSVADELSAIKSADRLTYADIGAVLGKSEDQAAKYCAGEADMGLVSFGRGKREWNGRFTGAFDRLCKASRPGAGSDRDRESSVLKAVLAMSSALANGEKITADDVRANRQTIEAAHDALGELLDKLGPRGVRA